MCNCQSDLRYDAFRYVPGKRLHEMPDLQAHLKQVIAQHKHTELRQGAQRQERSSKKIRKVLSLKIENPYAPMAPIWELANITSFSAQMAVRRALIHHRLADFSDPRIGRANVALMGVLDKGYKCADINPPLRRGNQDTPHEYAAHWIRLCKEKQGYKAFCEYAVPETDVHYADAACIIAGELHVWEVVYKCHTNLLSHLRACFVESNSVATATVVAFTKTQLKGLRDLVRSDPSLTPYADCIKFEVIEPYMRELYG